jgi:AhpD family alkylhydroperoxidase
VWYERYILKKEEEIMEKERVKEQLDNFFEYTVKFAEKYPEIASSFTTLMGSVIQDGKLKSKEKELIAVGIAVGLRCLPCIHAHTKSALNMGATEEEIMEAASVAILMAGGPGMAHVIEVMKAIEAFSEKDKKNSSDK